MSSSLLQGALLLLCASCALAESPPIFENCVEQFLYNAGVRPYYISEYADVMHRNQLSVDDLAELSAIDLLREFSRSYNITYGVDIVKIYECLRAEGRCGAAYCSNGGKCVFSDSGSTHVCQCANGFAGERCEKTFGEVVSDLQMTVDELTRELKAKGVTYTRWAKNSCNATAGAELVYNGYMAGSRYDHPSGSNYLCLPHAPVYGDFKPGTTEYGQIHSAELQIPNYFPPYGPLYQADPTCSVCRAAGRSSHVMFPATNQCPPSWTREYHGYLMASSKNRASSTEFVCIDRNPDVIPGAASRASTNGAEIMFIEARCTTGLPCPPYDEEKELTCAVCTR
ncbi:uncharacterized protein LOC135830609 [Sycon ciliatum]|uniref:uncharacterized protein LOC135830609 n=1 Tax=Sycon ciliatum TaxID=27933 RepID=UPI0020A8AC64|eukprot:scpid82136/ scgid9692/ Short-chain collagen C4